MVPQISIVIPSYNEATYIDRLLAMLTQQSFQNFEVIVSDAQSKDGTSNIVDSFSQKLRLKLVQSPPKGPSAGRNDGAKKAKGEWLLFLDADIDTDDKEFLQILLDETQRRGWHTSTTKYKVRQASFVERLGAAINYSYIRLLAHTKYPVAPGFCIFTKNTTFQENKGFDEKLFLGEDYDYVSRASNEGFGFVTSTYYYQDLRRFRQGNGAKVFFQNVVAEIYRHTHNHRIDKPPFKYEFGKHQKRGD